MEEDLRVKRTKKLLTLALLELMQTSPIEKISINEICDKAMVHRATFYNHFQDKNDLLNCALDELEEDMFESTIERGDYSSAKEMYTSLIVKFLDFVEENKEKFKLILSHNDEKIVSLISTTVKRSLRYLISRNKYTEDYIVPLNIIIDFFIGGMTFITLDWIQYNLYKKEELVQFFDILIDEKLFKAK